jgi:hypothetical protein
MKIAGRLNCGWLFIVLAALAVPAGLYLACDGSLSGSRAETMVAGFKQTVVDRHGPFNPWGKAVADLNGDGLADLIVGGHDAPPPPLYKRLLRKLGFAGASPTGGELVWYENPTWRKRVIARGLRFSTDIETVDMDGDGDNDVVVLTEKRVLWFRNPNWESATVDHEELHDIEVADFDGDGDMDIAGRNQSAFGGRGDRLLIYYQGHDGIWRKTAVPCPDGEGLKAADLDGDGLPDLVVNGRWFKNTGAMEASGWNEKLYAPTWDWPHTAVAIGDMNGDGRPDIILTPSEKVGSYYRISWFEAPPDFEGHWREHIIDEEVEAVHHSAEVGDMDDDGDIDIVTAEMHQGVDPDEVKIYMNGGAGVRWTKRVVSEKGSHNLKVADIDGDGDMDMMGANWSGDSQAVELWMNMVCRWDRHLIDAKKPWRSVFVAAYDMDADGRKDVVTGGWWYRNPGDLSGKWERRAIGRGANNMAVIFDPDGDGDMDVLATDGKVGGNFFVLARNDGTGSFEIFGDIPRGAGDFLQGAAAGEYRPGESGVALSWHEAGKGIQILEIPRHPETDRWIQREISRISQDEQLTQGDIDGDGDADLLMGTKWLRNDGGQWRIFDIATGKGNPDRNRLADLNLDGRLDAVVGFEAISEVGKVAWYEQGTDATSEWTEHVIGSCIGPMSLDVADMDGDGYLDVVVGEHNLAKPEDATLFIFRNSAGDGRAWEREVVYVGDEHHDGAQVADMDGDGDNDIVSIGWGHGKVVLYEKKCGLANKEYSLNDRRPEN